MKKEIHTEYIVMTSEGKILIEGQAEPKENERLSIYQQLLKEKKKEEHHA